MPPEYKDAAKSGAMLALAQLSESLAVTVMTIRCAPADTTPDDVKLAAANAVWQAIGDAPASLPYSEADGVHFRALPARYRTGQPYGTCGSRIRVSLPG